MAAAKTGYDIAVAILKRNKDADYAAVAKACEKKGARIYPIVYGRAKAALGLVPVAKRGEGKAKRESKRSAKRESASPTHQAKVADPTAKSPRFAEPEDLGMAERPSHPALCGYFDGGRAKLSRLLGEHQEACKRVGRAQLECERISRQIEDLMDEPQREAS